MMKKLVSTTNMSKTDWLKWRRKGIGGSDAAAIVGLSPWATPFTVYADKLGLLPEKQDNEAMRQGRDLEEYVAHRFCEATGKSVRRCNAIIQHEQYEFALANVDRLVVGEGSGLECKTMNPRSRAANILCENEIPPQYYVQCQHYMAVTGLQQWYLAILVLGVGFYWFDIVRDEADITSLLGAEKQFWEQHVIARLPPEPDESTACEDVLCQMYPKASHGMEIALYGVDDTLQRLHDVKAKITSLDAEKRKLENSIRADMQEAEIAHTQSWHITYKNQSKKTLDINKIRCENPKLFEKYAKSTEYRVLKIKEID